ncbi:hypothetical protein Tco_0611080 [Tanacetum coccineum]
MSQPANDEFSQHLSDDEASNHEDASDTGAAPKQQQQVIPQTTVISNIKLPILKKEEYDIWAMEMEHYLEYIDNVIAAEIQAVEKERKAKNIACYCVLVNISFGGNIREISNISSDIDSSLVPRSSRYVSAAYVHVSAVNEDKKG